MSLPIIRRRFLSNRLILFRRRFIRTSTRSSSSSSSSLNKSKLILGCGSNVIDLFYPLRRFPNIGEKTYFAEEQICSSQETGGVTLNHLVWARLLGAPTSLLALQGNDENGRSIREKLESCGVDTSLIRASDDYSTSVSHILSTPEGERTILMACASTSVLNAQKIHSEFGVEIDKKACMITTEISQLPLSGVLYLLQKAQELGILSVLDIDVTPTVALEAAKLGTKTQLKECLTSASIVKLTASAAPEVLSLMSPSLTLENTLDGMARQLLEVLGPRVCAVTDGSNGSALALGGREAKAVAAVSIPAIEGIRQVDATGAGDAFLGGLVACIHARGLPKTSQCLENYGRIATAAGAACVEVQGALPVADKSPSRVLELCPNAQSLLDTAKQMDYNLESRKDAKGDKAAGSSSAEDLAVNAFAHSIQDDVKALKDLGRSLTLKDQEDIGRAVAWIAAAHTKTTGNHSNVFTTGIGKSAIVASRLSSTLRSISVRSSYIPGNEWVHGDLGAISKGDVMICMSNSGKTPELVDCSKRARVRGARVIAITGNAASPLATMADISLNTKSTTKELLGKIPSRSIIIHEAISNGLVAGVAGAIKLTVSNYLDNHPGGAIGSSSRASSSLTLQDP